MPLGRLGAWGVERGRLHSRTRWMVALDAHLDRLDGCLEGSIFAFFIGQGSPKGLTWKDHNLGSLPTIPHFSHFLGPTI